MKINKRRARRILKRIRSTRVGARVRILRRDIHPLTYRRNRNGVITSIDGSLIMVRPMWCKWEVELYPNEIEIIGRK